MATDPENTVTAAVENSPHVQPWQVALACSIDQSDCSEESHDLYAGYLTRLLEKGCVLGDDEESLPVSLEMILTFGPPLDKLTTHDHKPRYGPTTFAQE